EVIHRDYLVVLAGEPEPQAAQHREGARHREGAPPREAAPKQHAAPRQRRGETAAPGTLEQRSRKSNAPDRGSGSRSRGAVRTERDEFLRVAGRAAEAAAELAPLPRAAKDAALHRIADALVDAAPEIVKANEADVARARENGISDYMIDRLSLTDERIAAIAEAVRKVAALPDPVGETVRGTVLPNGLELRQVRVPLGVVGIIYEGRPNVTVDAAALCLKSGNAVLLRGSSSAYDSNTALVRVMQGALAGSEVPADAVQLVPGTSRESAKHLM